jgi:hypothetical protein
MTLGMVLSDYNNLDNLLNKLSLEQKKVENLVDRLDLEINKILGNTSNMHLSVNEHKNMANTCLEVVKKLRKYDTELNRIRDELNEDMIRSKSSSTKNENSINLIFNNYYQTMCFMEYKMLQIQRDVEAINNRTRI